MRFYRIEITTLEPVVIGYDSSNESRDIISGTALRGLLIKENFNEFRNRKSELILSKDIIFTDAYLQKGNDYFIPTPKSFLCNKHDMKKLKKDNKKDINIKNCLFEPNENNENNEDKFMTEGIRSKFVVSKEESLQIDSVNKVEHMHINKNIKEGTGSLYRYEAINKGQRFYSLVILRDNQILNEEHLYKIEGEKYIGKSRSTSYGKVIIRVNNLCNYSQFKDSLNIKSVTQKGKNLDIYFLTDTILKDKVGNTVSILPKEEIQELFGLPKVEVANEQFITSKIIGGYNSHQKIPLPKDTAFEAGSIMRYEILDGKLTEEKIQKIEEMGLGYFRERGFGRVIINPNFEQKQLMKYEKNEDDNELNKGKEGEKINYHQEYEEAMFILISSIINENRKLDMINKIITDCEQSLIIINDELTETQINSFIIDLSNSGYKERYGLKKDKIYNDKKQIKLFGDNVKLFFENMKNNSIDKYLNKILEYQKDKDIEKIEDKKEFVKIYVREYLYFCLRGKDNE